MRLVAVYDANILYGQVPRDFMLELARTGAFRARFSAEILDEVFRSLRANRPDLDPALLERTRSLIERAVPDAMVTGHAQLLESLELPDPDDRHVLATAIHCGARVIVTANIEDFDHPAVREHGIEVQHPDAFVTGIAGDTPEAVLQALQRLADRYQHPPMTPAQILDALADGAGMRRAREAIMRLQ
jgi:predicted nucleic acid-binding protein